MHVYILCNLFMVSSGRRPFMVAPKCARRASPISKLHWYKLIYSSEVLKWDARAPHKIKLIL